MTGDSQASGCESSDPIGHSVIKAAFILLSLFLSESGTDPLSLLTPAEGSVTHLRKDWWPSLKLDKYEMSFRQNPFLLSDVESFFSHLLPAVLFGFGEDSGDEKDKSITAHASISTETAASVHCRVNSSLFRRKQNPFLSFY